MIVYESKLQHHGVKGMKWGVRRYQNKDGSLTNAGKSRYGGDRESGSKNLGLLERRKRAKAIKEHWTPSNSVSGRYLGAKVTINKDGSAMVKESYYTGLTDKQKKAIKIGAAVAGTALVAYGGYKLNKYIRNENMKIHLAKGEERVAEMFRKFDDNGDRAYKVGTARAVAKYRSTPGYAPGSNHLGTKMAGDTLVNTRRRLDDRNEIRRAASNLAKSREALGESYGRGIRIGEFSGRVDDLPKRLQPEATRMANALNRKAINIRTKSYIDANSDSFRKAAKNVYNAKKRKR